MKNLTILILFFTSFTLAQIDKSSKMGQTTLEELKMNVYDKDTTAAAVVLFEHGNTFILPNTVHNFRQDYYIRIKILNKKAFNNANFKLKYSNYDLVHNIEAVTYNLNGTKIERTKLHKKDIFISKLNERNKMIAFTMPNVKEGAVIEYKLSFSTNSYKIYNWTFQSKIPKKTSVLTAEISGSNKFNIKLTGLLDLDKEEIIQYKKCKGVYTCSNLNYQINNIPAFSIEPYISNPKNFISTVIFEKEYSDIFSKNKDLNSWEYLDDRLKSIDVLGIQLKKNRFLKKRMNPLFSKEKNDLEKAKKIYYWLKEYFTWNGKLNLFYNNDVKKAFKNKLGNNSAINLSLFNALKAVDINTKVAILSTRGNGFLTKLHPAITEFNYLIVVVNINGIDYFLDASDKFLQFGQTSFKALNGDVRVLDFEKGSYWQTIQTNIKNSKKTNITLTLNSEELFEGIITITNNGYKASTIREKRSTQSITKAINEFEVENIDLEILDYKITNLKNNEKPLIEKLKVVVETEVNSETHITINPFIIHRIKENPFKLKERLYPVNFGAPFSESFTISVKFHNNYAIESLPKSRSGKLPNNTGVYFMKVVKDKNNILIHFYYKINKSIFLNNEYPYLKEFFNQLIESEKSSIILKKI